MLACQIVGMKKPENFFFPNGRHLSLIPVFADIKHSRELAIIDVACISAQITQYGNGILSSISAYGCSSAKSCAENSLLNMPLVSISGNGYL